MPGDLPALGPQDLLWARGTAGKHFHVKSLTGTKEPLRDAKAEGVVCPAATGASVVSRWRNEPML